MKNKMELMQAAQKTAADNIAVVAPLEVAKLKTSAFDALSIHPEHYIEFANFFDQARGAYLAMLSQPVKPLPVVA